MTTCRGFRAIDRHFAGAIDRDAERTMRAHVVDCDACRGYYQRHLLLEAVTADAMGPQQRLAIGLGLGRRTRSWMPAAVTATLALASVVVVLALRPGAPEPTGMLGAEPVHMAARGGDAVVGFRIRGASHEALGHVDTIARTDELAFAYAATGNHAYLAVFGVDDTGRFYWYFPAWLDAGKVPTAIRVRPAAELVELSEAIRHDVVGHRLWIYTAFLDRAWTTVEIEARAGTPGGAMQLDGAVEPRYSVEVQ